MRGAYYTLACGKGLGAHVECLEGVAGVLGLDVREEDIGGPDAVLVAVHLAQHLEH